MIKTVTLGKRYFQLYSYHSGLNNKHFKFNKITSIKGRSDGDGLVLLTSFNLTILSAAFYNRGPPHFISISGLIGFNRIDLWHLLSLFNVFPWLLVVAMVVTNFRNVWNSFHKAVHDSFKSCPLLYFHLNYINATPWLINVNRSR